MFQGNFSNCRSPLHGIPSKQKIKVGKSKRHAIFRISTHKVPGQTVVHTKRKWVFSIGLQIRSPRPLTPMTHPRPGKTIRLSDQRLLGYQEYIYGNPRQVILFFPGLPGSRLFNPFVLATPQDTRLIILERPGIGLSTPFSQRTLLNWAKDVQEFLDQFGIDQVYLLGYSAGGPFALVERLT